MGKETYKKGVSRSACNVRKRREKSKVKTNNPFWWRPRTKAINYTFVLNFSSLPETPPSHDPFLDRPFLVVSSFLLHTHTHSACTGARWITSSFSLFLSLRPLSKHVVYTHKRYRFYTHARTHIHIQVGCVAVSVEKNILSSPPTPVRRQRVLKRGYYK